MKTVTLIPGDGIGPSVTGAAVRVVEATGVEINWERVDAGITAFEKCGSPLPAKTIRSIERNEVTLKGPLGTPIGNGFSSVNVQLRKRFDLYLNFRPVRSFDGIASRYKDVDLVIFRENIEDFYAGEARYVDDKNTIAELTGRISYENSRRFFGFVFSWTDSRLRRKITIGHKANIFKCYHEIFLQAARDVAAGYPTIQLEERIIDALCMQLVLDPAKFDVIVAPNVFGDIVSDMCAGFIGGLGLAPSANYGGVLRNFKAIFEAVHGTAPDIAGKNLANPTAVILSAALMLEFLDYSAAARKIRKSVAAVIAEGKNVTRDLNPAGVGTIEMTDAIIEKIKELK